MHNGIALVATAFAAAMVIVGTGCKRLSTGAKEEFASKYTCPEDRVGVRPRTDLSAYDVTFGRARAPSSEIARDPERLRLWNEQQKDKQRSWDRSFEVFEVTGCGHKVLMTCAHASQRTATSRRAGRVTCTEAKHPPDEAP
jgi:hypothetical protein